jgi:hypothetical protein
MRSFALGKAVALAVVMFVGSISSALAQTACSAFNLTFARVGGTPLNVGPYSLALNPGDRVTLTDGAGGFPTNTLTVGSTSSSFALVGSTSITVATAGTYAVSAALGPPAPPGSASLFCTPGPVVPGTTSLTPQQLSNNAQSAITNGQRTLQNYLEWVTKGVQGSFGMTRGGDIAAARQAASSAQAKAARLDRDQRELAEELRGLPADSARAADLERRLGAMRRDLAFARLTANISGSDGATQNAAPQPATTQEATARDVVRPNDFVIGTPQTTAAAPSSNPEVCETDTCQAAGGDPGILDRKWNTWVEGRVVGSNDSLAQTNALGFAGTSGIDYKFQPWLAVGMSVGVETYETRFGQPGVRTGTIGVSLAPYVGMRLSDNIFAEGFIGLTKLAYNTNPASGIVGNFDALRFFFGGGITGVWYEGRWRIQPGISGAYGTESQNGYTDSAANVVPGQTVSFGRITAGPEIGYSFKDENRGWSIEPFAMLKGAVDFASSPVVQFNGAPLIVRQGTQASALAGGGVALQLDRGFYLRVQGSYDSIGVSGLDVWSGRLRAGITF